MTHDLDAKIADFGHSEREYFNLDKDCTKSPTKVEPVAWCAYEVLNSFDKTYQSDVWSFGVFMWEVFMFGQGSPYAFLRENPEWKRGYGQRVLRKYLEDGHRLTRPKFCPNLVFDLMKKCWILQPNLRPTIIELEVQLDMLKTADLRLERRIIQSQRLEDILMINEHSPLVIDTEGLTAYYQNA